MIEWKLGGITIEFCPWSSRNRAEKNIASILLHHLVWLLLHIWFWEEWKKWEDLYLLRCIFILWATNKWSYPRCCWFPWWGFLPNPSSKNWQLKRTQIDWIAILDWFQTLWCIVLWYLRRNDVTRYWLRWKFQQEDRQVWIFAVCTSTP